MKEIFVIADVEDTSNLMELLLFVPRYMHKYPSQTEEWGRIIIGDTHIIFNIMEIKDDLPQKSLAPDIEQKPPPSQELLISSPSAMEDGV